VAAVPIAHKPELKKKWPQYPKFHPTNKKKTNSGIALLLARKAPGSEANGGRKSKRGRKERIR
jgi:hypothetical protein